MGIIGFIITIVGTAITTISFVYGYIQHRKIKKIEQLQISDALALHILSAQALGAVQGCKIGLSEGYCQTLLIDTAKIFCDLKNITIQEIDTMIADGRLNKNYGDIYKQFAKSNVK